MLAVPPTLKRLAINQPGVTSAMALGDSFTNVDYHRPLISLPNLLGIRLAAVPACLSYLHLPRAWRRHGDPGLDRS